MQEVIDNMNSRDLYISNYATKNKDSIRLEPVEEDIRTSFFRDIDRIIYSLSYTRYIDKTQVFSNIQNDNISKRMTHVQMVSKIARTIGRGLNLNEDLIEAIALGHDLGHVPFGHVGESILNDISQKYSNRMFNHNVQSARTLMYVENSGKGSNISIQVLDGILCHNGEFVSQEYYPIKKTKESFLEEYNKCYYDAEVLKKLHPMTLEGCVVRISDVIGYLGRDIEDAIRIGVFDISEVPKYITDILGRNNKEMINTIILDILKNSVNKPYIKISDNVYNAICDLKAFNYEHIYDKANSLEDIKYYKLMFNSLFVKYLSDIDTNNIDADIYKVFLNNMDSSYLNNTTKEEKVIDFIAGMTDEYIKSQFSKNIKCSK